MNALYTERQHIINTLKIKYDYWFENEKIKFKDKVTNPVTFTKVIEFLNEEHDLPIEDGNDIIIEWAYGIHFLELLERGEISIE